MKLLQSVLCCAAFGAICSLPASCSGVDIRWTNTAGGAWSVAANWDPNQVPGAADTAIITNDGTYVVRQDVNASIAGLQLGGASGMQTLSNVSPALSLSGTGMVGANGALVLNGGVLDGVGTLTVNGRFDWMSGTMQGAGQCVFGPSSVLTLSGPSTKYLRDRAISLEGTASWSGGQWFGGYGAVVNIQDGALLNVESEAGAPLWFGAMTLNNAGTVRKTTGAGLSYFNWTVNNSGLALAQIGTLGFDGGGAQTGQFEATATANTIRFGGGRHELLPGVSFTGPGLFSIENSADARFQGLITTGTRWRLSGNASLNGTNAVTFTGPFDWQGGTMGDTGQTIFSDSATLSLSTGNTKYLRDRTVSLDGTGSWSGGQWFGGYGAVFNIRAAGALHVESEAGAPVWFGAITLNNAGTLRKSAGAGLSYFNWTVNNSGLAYAQSGTLGFSGGGAQAGIFQTAATPNMIHFGGGRHELLPGVSFTGPGLFSIGDSGDVRFQTNLTTSARWRLSGNAALNGTNAVTFTGPFDWQGGTMGDTGHSLFGPGGGLTLTTAATKYIRERTLTIQGTANWAAGQWFGGYGAVVNVQSGAALEVQSEAGAPVWFGVITLNNGGTIRKTAGTGLSSFNWTVNNGGMIDAPTGTMGWFGGGVQTGLFQAGPSAVMHFGGGRHELLPGVNFTGAGGFSIGDNGDVRFQTALTNGAAWRLSGNGALNGTNTVAFTGPFEWQGGTMGDLGQTVFRPGSFLHISTASAKYLRERTVTMGGQAWWSAGQWFGGYGATLNVQPGAVLDVQSEAGAPVWFGAVLVNNAGTLRKSSGTGLSSFNWTVNNSGMADVQAGTLGLHGGGLQTGLFQTSDAAATMHFGGGRHELLAGANFTGPGLFSIGDNGDVRFQTAITSGARWRLSGNAALNGTNTVTFTGPFDWLAGTMGDVGQTAFGPSATVALSTVGTKYLRERRLNLAGSATWTGGQWFGGYGAVVSILGSGVLDAQSEAGAPVWFGSILLHNRGTLRKSAGAGLSSFNWTVTNYASVRSLSGTLGFFGSYVQSSGVTTLEGGHLAGALLDIRGGELRGGGHIAADVRNWADVHPGSPSNVLSISNNVTQVYSNTAIGRLNLQLGGLIPGTSHDQLRVHGQANLAGAIHVDFVNDFLPTVGNSFTVMTYTARSGQFDSIVSPPGLLLQAAYFPTHLVLNAVTVTQVPPFIITQPTNVVIQEGLTASFRVVAGGTPALNYQWQLNATNLPGATSDTLVIPNVTVTNAGAYRVLVSNLGGITNSVTALLIVEPGFQTVELETATTNVLTGAAFVNGLDGVIVGLDGAMQVTRDGGVTWTTVNSGMTNIADAQFVGGAIFIAGGGPHTICVSYDGGETWSAAYSGPQRINRMRFLSSTNGVAVGDDGAILRWDGVAWTPDVTGIDVRLLSVDFCGGFPVAVGEGGRVYRFDGTNWVLRHTEVDLATFNDVRFCANGSVGLAVGTGGVIYQTTDCGLSWSLYNNPVAGGTLHSIASGDCNTWFVSGDDGTLLQSTDGGQTWNTLYSGATDAIREVVFIDGYGYYVDDRGHVHRFIYAPIPRNPPPVVRLVQPVSGWTNWACVRLPLRALASDTNGYVTQVEFLAGPLSLAVDTVPPAWTASWTNEILGEFVLTAVAIDNLGATGVSTPVKVTYVLPPLHQLVPVGFMGRGTNAGFKVCMTGQPGRQYDLLAHTNVAAPLATWTNLGLMMPMEELFGYLDHGATNLPHRFYRARQVP